MFEVSPSYLSTISTAIPCARRAMAAGYRWTAGFSQKSSTTSSGSMAAMPAGDHRSPRRSLMTIGDLNAQVIGTCWSSSIPKRRAQRILGEEPLASSSNVIGKDTAAAMAPRLPRGLVRT